MYENKRPAVGKMFPLRLAFLNLFVSLYTRFSFYKNTLYKNIEAEKRPTIRNILRIC